MITTAAAGASTTAPYALSSSSPALSPPSPIKPTRAFSINMEGFADFVEDEVMRHFELVQAAQLANSTGHDAEVAVPDSWVRIKGILGKLAYDDESSNPWRCLGFGALEGPEPSEHNIGVRAQMATMVCSMGLWQDWPREELAAAQAALSRFELARTQCINQLDEVLRERRKFKAPTLPLWKELGLEAVRVLKN